jgi:hypothetical protein
VGLDGHLELCTRTHACTADIENFVSDHPWATMVDVEIYRDAWVLGALWGERNFCKPERQNSAQDTS